MIPFVGRGRRGTITTLTIENREARFLTARHGRVEAWGSVALPEGAVEAGSIRDAEAAAPLLDDLFRRHRLDRRHVIGGVSVGGADGATAAAGGGEVVALGLALPRLEGEALAEAVHDAAERRLPVPVDSMYLHWQVLATGGPSMRVYVLGVPRGPVDAHVALLRAARIRPYVMDLKALAVIRAARPPQAIVARVEHDYVDLGVVVDAIPVALRTTRLRLGAGGAHARLDALLDAAARLLEEYQGSHPQAPVAPDAPLLISGQLLLDRDAAAYLARRGWRPVAPISSPLPFPQALPVDRYIVHMGLALKSV